MANRNEVIIDLKMNSELQLKKAADFEKQLKQFQQGMVFDDKVTKQFQAAEQSLKQLSTVLQKASKSSSLPANEIDNIIMAGQEIARVIRQTEQLQNNLRSMGLKQFSEEYIAETKRIQQAREKIYDDFYKTTGKNYEKELKSLEQLQQKQKQLDEQRKDYQNQKVNNYHKNIENTTRQLEEQKRLYEELIRLQSRANATYDETLAGGGNVTAAREARERVYGESQYTQTSATQALRSAMASIKKLTDKLTSLQNTSEEELEDSKIDPKLNNIIKQIDEISRFVQVITKTAEKLSRLENLVDEEDLTQSTAKQVDAIHSIDNTPTVDLSTRITEALDKTLPDIINIDELRANPELADKLIKKEGFGNWTVDVFDKFNQLEQELKTKTALYENAQRDHKLQDLPRLAVSIEETLGQFQTTENKLITILNAYLDALLAEHTDSTDDTPVERKSNERMRNLTKQQKQDLNLAASDRGMAWKNILDDLRTDGVVDLDKITHFVKGGAQEGKQSSPMPSMAEEAEDLAEKINKAGTQAKFLGSAFDDIKNRIGYMLSLNYIFDQISNTLRKASETIKTLDRDMTQIGLVLGKTSSQVWASFDTYSEMANRLHTTTSAVVGAMKLFYQQGLNTAQVNKMVEASAIAAALGETSLAEAAETLTSVINSYNLSAQQAMEVTDKISVVAIESAADFGELSEAIEKVASSASTIGLDLDHLMGYLGKMIETTREAPTNIGTSLKTIISNFSEFKEDPTFITDEGQTINDVDEALQSVGIALLDTAGEMRDLGDVLDELGMKWSTLNRNTKAYLTTAIAGNRQSSRFYALMNDYERTLQLVNAASVSSGKSTQQFSLYTENLESAVNRLNNEWENFYKKVASGNGVLKVFYDVLTNLLRFANFTGPIGTVLGIGAFVKQIRSATEDLSRFTNQMTELKTNDVFKGLSRQEIIDKVDSPDWTEEDLKLQFSLIDNEEEIYKLQKALKDTTALSDKANLKFQIWGKTIQGAFVKGAHAVKIFGKAIVTALAQFAVVFVVSKLIEGLITVFDALTTSVEELAEAAQKASDNASSIRVLADEYKSLTSQLTLTAEEQERLKEITEEVIAVDKKLGAQLKNNKEAYQENLRTMEAYIDAQERLSGQKTAQAALKTGKNATSLGELATYLFGSRESKRDLRDFYTNNLYSLAGGRIQQYQLDTVETSMVDMFTSQFLKKIGSGTLAPKDATAQFNTELIRFIQEVQALNANQIRQYNEILAKRYDETTSFYDYQGLISQSQLPREVINYLMNELSQLTARLRDYSTNNPYVTNDVLFNSNTRKLGYGQLDNILNYDRSLLSERESLDLDRSIALFFENTQMVDNYIDATKKGAQATTDFANSLLKTGQITDIFKDVIITSNTLEQTFKKAADAIEKFSDEFNNDFVRGLMSQYDVIAKYLSREIAINDLNITSYGQVNVDGTYGTLLTAKTRTYLNDIDKYIKTSLSAIDQQIVAEKTKLDEMYRNEAYDYDNKKQGALEQRQELNEVKDKQAKVVWSKSSEDLWFPDTATHVPAADDYGQVKKDFILKYKEPYYPEKDQNGWPNLQNYDANEETLKRIESNLEVIEGQIETIDKDWADANKRAQIINNTTSHQIEIQKEVVSQYEKMRIAMESILNMDAMPMKKFTAVFDTMGLFNTIEQRLEGSAKAYEIASDATQHNHENVQRLVSEYPHLLNMVKTTAQGWRFNTETIYENTKAMIDAEIEGLDSKIRGTKAILEALKFEETASNKTTQATKEDIIEAISYYHSQGKEVEETVEDVGEALQVEVDQYTDWSNQVTKAYQKVIEAQNKYKQGLASQDQVDYARQDLEKITLDKTNKVPEAPPQYDDVLQAIINNASNKRDLVKKMDSSEREELIAIYQRQLDLLESSRAAAVIRRDNIGKYLKSLTESSSSKDDFEEMIERLDRFYNYLRKIEAVENKLTNLESKQGQLDLITNYDTGTLEEQNELLKEKYHLLTNMIPEQQEYLALLRKQMLATYGNWASFTDEGVIQVSQTEFKITSEDEKKHYEEFTRLREEYEKEWQDNQDRITERIEIQNTIVENLESKYEKLNQKLSDEKDILDAIIELEEHRQEISFREFFPARYYESILTELQESYEIQNNSFKNAVINLRELDNRLRDLNISKWVEFNDLTQKWQYSAQYTTDLLAEDTALMAQIANIQSLLKDYELASEYLKTAKTNMQEIESTIKSMVDGALSQFESSLDTIIDQNSEILDIYQKSLDVMETENNLYDGSTKELQKYYDLTVEAAGAAKYAMKAYQDTATDAIDQILKKYGEYVTEVNGQYAINEALAKENLTSNEIIDLEKLLTLYESMNKAAEDSQDQFYDYMDSIKQLEEEKRDAIISIMQQVRDELQNLDQEELDDLQEKYDEMNRLDNEYYSSLSQKINDARKKRDRQQSAQDVSQLRNQIAVLERDSSGAFSTELRDLRQQLIAQLQNQADQNIDDELERISREQEERQKDREIQITQMENLISFKEENGMYWDEAYSIWETGRASVESFLAAMYNRQDLSKEEIAQKIQETNATLDTAWVEYGNVNAQKVGEVISPIAEHLRELKTTALPEIKTAIDMNEGAIETATTTVVTALENIESAIREIYNLEDNAKVIEEMMGNGKKWKDASTEEKAQLNATNKALGSSIGLTYDAPTGLYYDKYGQAAYNGTNKTQYNPKYDIIGMTKASEQMQANGDQWRENMTPSEKNALHEKNVKLAAPYGWYYDPATGIWYTDPTKKQRVYDVYKNGGYVDYTGFAKVDGTPSKPEAFLNAQQTQLFEQLRDSLAGKKLRTTTNDSNNEGDSIIINNLEISVKEIADADSIDKVVKTVKQSIYKDATATSGITKVSRR